MVHNAVCSQIVHDLEVFFVILLAVSQLVDTRRGCEVLYGNPYVCPLVA